ncbi:MAG: hypothetical protein GY863_03100 [bacterium]|nr:hypothetical protein [bacterium]
MSQEVNENDDIKLLKEQLERLKEAHELKLKELESLINEIKTAIEQKEQEEELQKLLEEASQLKTVEKDEESGIAKKFHSGLRQQSGLNPNISVTGDFFGNISSSNEGFVKDRSDAHLGSNGFDYRELQLNLVAPLDPFTRGKAFISFGENGVTIEEGYLDWLNLPLSMNLKVGLFRPEFGAFNRWHDHALPQFDRPKALVNLFSVWSLAGLGASSNFLLPPLLFSDASMLDIAVVNGGADFSFTGHSLLYVGHFKNFYDVSQDAFFEWAVSGTVGKNDPEKKYNSYIGSLALTYKWTPVDRSKYRMIDWKTEFLLSRREGPYSDIDSFGFYTSLQNKMNARWWTSFRIGYSELPFDNEQYEWDYTGCVDFWQSEFVFIRLQYQYSDRHFTNYTNYPGPYPSDHSLVFHVCWAMGPHKHEKY